MPTKKQIPILVKKGYQRKALSTMGFVPSIIELLKNALDHNAPRIFIDTDRESITVRDNGTGMGEKEREAFIQLGVSTAGEKDHGQFGSGGLRCIHSIAREVQVVTYPEEDPNHIYKFRIDVDSYEVGQHVLVEDEVRTDENWPHESYGSQIRLVFVDPSKQSIRRGNSLARELSNLLSERVTPKILVDGNRLPARVEIGSWSNLELSDPDLGMNYLEVWRLEGKQKRGTVLAGAGDIPEVPIQKLLEHVGEGDVQLHPVYTVPGVRGVFSWPVLRKYASEQRTSFSDSLGTDPRLRKLILLLNSYAPAVMASLQLHIRQASADDEGATVVRDMIHEVTRHYSPEGVTDNKGPGETITKRRGPQRGPSKPKGPLVISVNRSQYRPGELITIKAELNAKGSEYTTQNLRWLLDDAMATPTSKSRDQMELVAGDEYGRGTVRAEIPGSQISAVASYTIVESRRLEIVMPAITAYVGEDVHINIRNTDLLEGREPVWRVEGPGQIVVEGKGHRVKFSSDETGTSTVRVHDPGKPESDSLCVVTVLAAENRREDLMVIRDHRFTHQVFTANTQLGTPFVTLLPGRAGVHEAHFHVSDSGYQKAHKEGRVTGYFLQSLAHAYGIFLERLQDQENSSYDIPAADRVPFLERFSEETTRLMTELTSANLGDEVV